MLSPDQKAYNKAYYARNAEKMKQKSAAWYKAHPEVERDKHLQRKFGISKADYDAMFARQHGRCAICLRPEAAKLRGKVKALCVDHDHITGKVRELLCNKCNQTLGLLNEDDYVLGVMIGYIQWHNTHA